MDCGIVILCGNEAIIQCYVVFYSVIQKWGGPSSNPSTSSNSLSLTHPHPYPFFSSIIYIIIKDQQIYSTSLIFFGPSLLCSLDLSSQRLAQPIAQAARRKVKNFGQMLFGLLFNFSSNNEEPSLIFRKVGLFLERSQYIQWFEKQSHLPSLIFRKVGIKLERD